MGQYERKRATEKAFAVEALSEVLCSIEQQEREPDQWERRSLCHGINAVFRGLYSLAVAEAESAVVPRHQRCEASLQSADVFKRFDLSVLRKALAVAESEPMRLSRQFGPIVILERPKAA
jgi:hypothetical protein